MPEDFVCTKITKMMTLLGGNVAHIYWPILQRYPKLIERCHEQAIIVHSHIFQSPIVEQKHIYRRMSELGIDQCTFDDIALVAAVKR